mgnify:CR=1 FL=1
MRLIYTKPKLKDLSQGSRIAFVRQFRFLTQDDVSDKLGLTGDCKRRTIIVKENVIVLLTHDGCLKKVSKKSFSSSDDETGLKPEIMY